MGAAAHFAKLIEGIEDADLSRDEAVAALHCIEATLETCACCALHKASRGSIPSEAAMASMLLSEWAKAVKGPVKAGSDALASGKGKMSEEEIERVLQYIDNEIDRRFRPRTGERLPVIMHNGYEQSKRRTYKRFAMNVAMGFLDEQAVSWLTRHHLYWIHNYYDKHLSAKIAEHVADGLKDGLGRQQIGNHLREFFETYPGVPLRPDSYWRGLAANGMNRARVFSGLQAYEEIGITQLVVVAILDERTSEICREMNGRVITLQPALDQRNAMMAAQSPEDVKRIAPWHSVSALRQMTGMPQGRMPTSAIIGRGMCLPPYHFHCRSDVIEHREGRSVPQGRFDVRTQLPRNPTAEQAELFSTLPTQRARVAPQAVSRAGRPLKQEMTAADKLAHQYVNATIVSKRPVSVRSVNSPDIHTDSKGNQYLVKKVVEGPQEAIMEEVTFNFANDIGIDTVLPAKAMKRKVIMEYFDGTSLSEYIGMIRTGALPNPAKFERAVMNWVGSSEGHDMMMMDWLLSAKDRHPGNIMFRFDGDNLTARLIDNGRAFFRGASPDRPVRNYVAWQWFRNRIARGHGDSFVLAKSTQKKAEKLLKSHGWKKRVRKPDAGDVDYDKKMVRYEKMWQGVDSSIDGYFRQYPGIAINQSFANLDGVEAFKVKVRQLVESKYVMKAEWFTYNIMPSFSQILASEALESIL